MGVFAALFYGAAWVTWQLDGYEELGDYLLRLGLSWIFMTFLAFLTFSGIVTALSTFFLSDDLRLLLAAPVAARRLFYARFARTVAQSSWMVIVFLTPVLLGVGVIRSAPATFYVTAALTIVPFAVIPVAVGTASTLLLVNVFPARRARDLLMLMGFLFVASVVILLRMIRPERLLRAESLPDLTGFFSAMSIRSSLLNSSSFHVIVATSVPHVGWQAQPRTNFFLYSDLTRRSTSLASAA